jgi:hypothetical protein
VGWLCKIQFCPKTNGFQTGRTLRTSIVATLGSQFGSVSAAADGSNFGVIETDLSGGLLGAHSLQRAQLRCHQFVTRLSEGFIDFGFAINNTAVFR